MMLQPLCNQAKRHPDLPDTDGMDIDRPDRFEFSGTTEHTQSLKKLGIESTPPGHSEKPGRRSEKEEQGKQPVVE